MACLLTLQFDRTDIFFPHAQKGHSETPTLQHATLHPLPHLPVRDEGMRSTSTSPRQSSISVPISLHGTQPHYFPLLHVAEAHQAGEQVPKTDPTAPQSHAGPSADGQGEPYSLLWRSQFYSQSHIALYICCDPAAWFHRNVKKWSTLQPKWSSGFTLQHTSILQPAG